MQASSTASDIKRQFKRLKFNDAVEVQLYAKQDPETPSWCLSEEPLLLHHDNANDIEEEDSYDSVAYFKSTTGYEEEQERRLRYL